MVGNGSSAEIAALRCSRLSIEFAHSRGSRVLHIKGSGTHYPLHEVQGTKMGIKVALIVLHCEILETVSALDPATQNSN